MANTVNSEASGAKVAKRVLVRGNNDKLVGVVSVFEKSIDSN
ncbi:hypothetical protein [Alteromonas sp. BMJM2]|nr:hypothetical protein [Alteromonas sp. BMJM2]